MGAVHEAIDERLGRRVAVKLLKEEYADDPTFVARFVREARAAAALGHPNIAQVFDSGQDGDLHFIVMELVEGSHLGQVLREQGRMDTRAAVDVVGQVCEALAVAHAAGIVHRDIKPGNVLVRPDGQVKVTDFGIAHRTGDTALTGTGMVLGTAQYLSPEQASGQAATPASDVYATGVLLYQLLTGVVPFEADSPLAVALAHVRDDLPPVREVAPEVPAAVAAVVARATARDPEQRYPDAQQMAHALRGAPTPYPDASTAGPATMPMTAPTGRSTAPEPPQSAAPAAVPESRRPITPRVMVTAGLALVAALLVGWIALSNDPAPETGRADPAAPGASSADSSGSPEPTAPSPTDDTADGPVVPANAVGRDVKTLEQELRERGYDAHKVDIDATATRDTIVATIPAPGQPLAPGQSILLIASKGEVREPSDYLIPDDLVGTDVKSAEERLKDQGIEPKKADIDSDRPKGEVVATYPEPGTRTETGIVVLAVSRGP
jgi:serine/threonine protein kinase